jgi:hypothetical protein
MEEAIEPHEMGIVNSDKDKMEVNVEDSLEDN